MSKFYEVCESYNGDEQLSVLSPVDVNVLGAHLFYALNRRDNQNLICSLFDILCTTASENIRKSELYFIGKLCSL